MRASRAIRATAWAVVAVGVAGPVLRRRISLPPGAVLAGSVAAPVALCVALPRSRPRDLALCALNMWGYLAAYEMPHEDPERQARRVRWAYPARVDRALGLGVLPTLRLQRAFSAPSHFRGAERVLVWCHWVWFAVPHSTVIWVMLRRPRAFTRAAVRMYAVFDLGAVFYWLIPTAPPWWASDRGLLDDLHPTRMRRMMSEYGEEFWGERWSGLYAFLGGNPLAAMPSLHFATSLMAASLLTEVGPVSGTVGWSYAVLLGLALVYLGEHYVADLLAGAGLAAGVRAAQPRLASAAAPLSRLVQALETRAALAP